MGLFEKHTDPYEKYRIGTSYQIQEWLENNANISKDSIEFLNDGTHAINLYASLNLVNLKLKRLPEFLNINILYGDFWGAGNDWETLEGFPNEIHGDLQLRSISVPCNCNHFSEEYIKKLIKVYGNIWF